MKIFKFSLMLIGMLLASCSNGIIEEPQTSQLNTSITIYPAYSVNRSLDEAIDIANEAKKMLNGKQASRTHINREINIDDGIKYITSPASRSTTDTLIYILNYKNNAGFAIISAKRSATPLLAVIESGTYTSLDDCDNPGFKMFMDLAIDYVAYTPTNLNEPGDNIHELYEIKREEKILAGDTVQHRVQLEWSQNRLYGSLCPNEIAGCNNVAAAMAMSYFEFPKSLYLSYMSVPKTISLDWKNIKRHKTGEYTHCCQPNPPHTSIAELIREIGHRSNSIYHSNVTETYPSKTRNTLKDLGYKVSDFKNYSTNCIRTNLGEGLIIISGYNSDQSAGHTWLVDGYKYQKKQVIEYEKPISSSEWTVIGNYIIESAYNWFNWGWGSGNEYNGYYDEDVFSPRNTKFDYKYNIIFFTINL